MTLNRETILAVKYDLPRKEVEVPEWGGSVFVRTLTSAERDAYEAWCLKKNGGKLARSVFIVWTCCDETGKPIFTTADLPSLNQVPSYVLERVFDAAMKINKITAEDVEALEKN